MQCACAWLNFHLWPVRLYYIFPHLINGRIFIKKITEHYVAILSTTSFWNSSCAYTRSDNKVRELIAVKVLHTSLLNTTVVAFKVLRLGSYVPMPAPSPPFKTILELVLWNGLQSCRCITLGVINVIKMPSFQYFLYLQEQKKVTGG